MTEHTAAVPAHVLLYAYRYGIGRMTYAQADAIDLIKTQWPVVRRWRDSIRHDAQHVADSGSWSKYAPADVIEAARALVEWIDEQDDDMAASVALGPRDAGAEVERLRVDLDEAAHAALGWKRRAEDAEAALGRVAVHCDDADRAGQWSGLTTTRAVRTAMRGPK